MKYKHVHISTSELLEAGNAQTENEERFRGNDVMWADWHVCLRALINVHTMAQFHKKKKSFGPALKRKARLAVESMYLLYCT